MQTKIVDIYMPLDAREAPNREVWPVATKQLAELVKVIGKCGWTANLLNAGRSPWRASPRASRSNPQGARAAASSANFMAGWAYPDFSVSPMAQLPRETPKLMLGSLISDYPGAVGLHAAASGTAHVGIETSRLFIEHFDDHATYENAIATFLDTGKIRSAFPRRRSTSP